MHLLSQQAPFDFRKAPNEMSGLFVRLRQLIEHTYSVNGNKRVVIICHSMGNPLFVNFINTMTQVR